MRRGYCGEGKLNLKVQERVSCGPSQEVRVRDVVGVHHKPVQERLPAQASGQALRVELPELLGLRHELRHRTTAQARAATRRPWQRGGQRHVSRDKAGTASECEQGADDRTERESVVFFAPFHALRPPKGEGLERNDSYTARR